MRYFSALSPARLFSNAYLFRTDARQHILPTSTNESGVVMIDKLAGKNILVTGGTGSIGAEIVRQVLQHNPKQVRIFSRDEHKQFQFANELADEKRVRFLLGDVRDKNRLLYALEEVDVVFHAAALKHVPVCEYNPFEAVKTNVLGVQNVIEGSLATDVSLVVNISTDKAVNPSSTMGVTKLLAEKLMLNAGRYKGARKTVFTTVRFGNIIGSRSSVVPELMLQAATYGRMLITDPKMTRYVMTKNQAVAFALQAAQIAEGGEIFILKMPKVKLPDLVEALRRIVVAETGCRDLEIKVVGIRKGEKLAEELVSPVEWPDCCELPEMIVLKPGSAGNAITPTQLQLFTSAEEPFLAISEIQELVESWLDTSDGQVIRNVLRSAHRSPDAV